MIQLFIDNQETVLPENFSLQLTEENPFFTKDGRYTYDIELSLLNSQNARIYSHVNRQNTISSFIENRSARLIVQNKEVMNGTEIILEYSDRSVKIQLVSENSEFNFFIRGSQKLRMLDLGMAEIKLTPWKQGHTPSSHHFLYDNIDKPYPENDWLVIPFYDRVNDVIGNWYALGSTFRMADGLQYMYEAPYVNWSEDFKNYYYINHRPQPYFCFIIQKVIEAQGYTIASNFLAEHIQLKYLYIVHGYDTLEFSKMLPDWTVNEFLTQIEQLFDCSFIVNERERTVNLIQNYNRALNIPEVSLVVNDEYTTQVDTEHLTTIAVANIAYDLSDDIDHKFQHLSNDVMTRAKQVDLTSLYGLNNAINDTTDTSEGLSPGTVIDNRTRTLWNVSAERTSYIAASAPDSNLFAQKVNAFKPLINNIDDPDTINITLKIVPAAMAVISDDRADDHGQMSVWMQLPVADVVDPFFMKKSFPDAYTLEGIVEGEVTFESPTISDRIQLAFYDGRHECEVKENTWNYAVPKYPIPYVDNLSESYGQNLVQKRFYNPLFNLNPGFLRLSELDRYFYSLNMPIDSRMAFRVRLMNHENLNIRANFIINNKRFVCTKIERQVTALGYSDVAIGYFHPID